MWILLQTRRFVSPCLRVQRENSPPDCFLFRVTPLAFTLDLDPGAVDQQVQRAFSAAVGDIHLQDLLPSRQRAELKRFGQSLEPLAFTCSAMNRFNALGTAGIERVA